ncbi:MAG TPA: type VI secretion system contractile sheath large subunit [Bryobacteraceae bacterium]|nr:type VI secretion system contractile sheath large subunit [Bryobacteraceae bacterium]
MPKSTYADVQLEVDPGRPQTKRELNPGHPDRDTPFRMLVLGDFSGRASRGIAAKGPRKPVAVDRDNFEDVLESLNVQVRLPLQGGSPLDLFFHELDDFHPDKLFQRLPVFKKIRELREQLETPETFAAAARELGIGTGAPKTPAPAPPPVPTRREAGASLLGGSLLDQALEATESRGAAAPSRSVDPMAHYLRSLVGPHLTPKPDPKKKEVMQQVDDATGGVMRSLLHHPLFQQVESAWRSLYFLIKELETGPLLKVYLLDISRQELETDLAEADDLKTTALYKVLVEQTVRTPGAHPWALVVGAFDFGPDMSDLNLLARMGLLARQAGAPFVAGGSAQLLGCKSLAKSPYPQDWKPGPELEGWALIRSLPESKYLGLVAPRFLLRMPYGKTSEATEAFEFEEMPGTPDHESYLWGNSAFVCAYLLGQMFTEFGWGMRGDEILTLHRLPMHVYKEDGEAKMTPCGEAFLSETAMERMHEAGLMCLMSFANSDQVRLAGFRSVSAGGDALASRWG